MRKLSFILALLMICSFEHVFSQVKKGRAHGFAYRLKADNGQWMEWEPWAETNVLIVFPNKSSRVIIYSENTQVFDFISNPKIETGNEGIDYVRVDCIDSDGARCFLRILSSDADAGNYHLYIHYSDLNYVYEYKIIDE